MPSVRPVLRVTFELRPAPGEDPAAQAAAIACEQTVELPRGAVPAALAWVPGTVEELSPLGAGAHRAVIAYDASLAGPGPGQLVNLLFGNVSLQLGVRIVAIDWPEPRLAGLPGPRFGIAGLRRLAGVERRALLCAAVKPLGLAPAQLAARAALLARSGADLVKDDHSLADQPEAPFQERAARCQEAVLAANRAAGGRTLYVPNLTGDPAELSRRAAWLRDLGVAAALVSPLILGADATAWLARESGLALIGHPALAGAFFTAGHGIAPRVLLGELLRLLGCDGVIYPNAGGRFPLDLATCEAINATLRGPLAAIRPAFPVPGGGLDRRRLPEWLARYGRDTVFLIGGSLYAAPDLEAATRELAAVIRASG